MTMFAGGGDWTGVIAASVTAFFGWLTVRAQTSAKGSDQLDELERKYLLALVVISAYLAEHPDTPIPIPDDIEDDLD